MLSFLQNAWVVGIGGGIISGMIVFFITNWIYKRKDNSKYLEQISRANSDIIHVLKPYVAEKGLPDKEIVDAIIVSIARKYNVKTEELYSIRIVCEELIREIIENVYVSSIKKQEYSMELNNYLRELSREESHKAFLISDIEKEIKNSTVRLKSDYRRKTADIVSTLVSIFTGIVTFVLCIYKLPESSVPDMINTFEIAFNIIKSLLIVVFAISFFAVAFIGFFDFPSGDLNVFEKTMRKNKKKSKRLKDDE